MTDVPETATEGGGQCQSCLAKAKTRHVRAWRWITSLDLTKPPAPILRWALLLILGLCCWAAGIPLDIKDWLAPIIIAGALILPDVAGFGIAGIRLDLKQAQDEITALHQEFNAQARADSAAAAAAGAGIAIGDKAIAALSNAFGRAANQAASDQASGASGPWSPSRSGTQPAKDIPS